MAFPLRKQFVSAAAVACAALLPAAAAHAQSADKPVRGGTLVFANHYGEAATFDCHAPGASMMRLSPHYSSLLQIDGDNYPKVKGDLAQSWKISPDGLRYEFKLHPNVKFHDGTTLTSKDVKVSYDRMRAPPSGVVSARKALFEDISSIETPDATTVVFNLSAPNAAMLSLLGNPFACVYSAKMLAEDPSYPAKKVMGSGPFKFTRTVPGQEWVGERFDNYFRTGRPYLDGFRQLSLTPPAMLTALASGQVAYGLRGQTKDEVDRIIKARGAQNIQVLGEKTSTAVVLMVAVNTTRKPFDDPRVRRALLMSMDRWGSSPAIERIVSLAKVGGLIRPNSEFARTDKELEQLPGYARDMEATRKEARRLLAEAGHPNLKLTLVNNKGFPWLGVLVVDQLRQIGVTAEHVMLESAQVHARRGSGDYDLIMDNMPEYLDDPTVQMAMVQSFKDNPLNTSRANDPKSDQLYEAQKREMDPKKRKELVQALEAHVLNQGYFLPFYWNSDFRRAVSADLGGMGHLWSNYSKLDLSDFWLKSAGK